MSNHLKETGTNEDTFSSSYDNSILLGDFNVKPTEAAKSNATLIYEFKSIIRGKTNFNDSENAVLKAINRFEK